MFIQKNKAVSFVVSFQNVFSSSDHLNVITTNFDYTVAKTWRKKWSPKSNITVACMPADIGKNIIEIVVFTLYLRKSSQSAS